MIIVAPKNEIICPLKRKNPRMARMNPARISPITAGNFNLESKNPNRRTNNNANAMRKAMAYIVAINLLNHFNGSD